MINHTTEARELIHLYEPYIDGGESLNQINRKRDISKETVNKDFNSTTRHD